MTSNMSESRHTVERFKETNIEFEIKQVDEAKLSIH